MEQKESVFKSTYLPIKEEPLILDTYNPNSIKYESTSEYGPEFSPEDNSRSKSEDYSKFSPEDGSDSESEYSLEDDSEFKQEGNTKFKLMNRATGTTKIKNFIRWKKSYEKLRNFIQIHDRLPHKQEKNMYLYTWTITQRVKYNKGTLSPSKISMLEGLKYWTWEVSEHKWMQKFEELKKFVQENHRLPSKTYNGGKLGQWVITQRERYKVGKLYDHRISLLKSIEGWFWARAKKTPWDRKYDILRAHINRHNRIPYTGDTKNWIMEQIKYYNEGTLSEYRIEKLEGLKKWSWGLKDKPVTKKRKIDSTSESPYKRIKLEDSDTEDSLGE